MSHEIRTPMTAVIGITHLLQQSELTARQRDWIDKLRSSGEMLLEIINDILDFSKIEAGKLDIVDIDFELMDLVENTMRLFAEKAAAKKLDFSYNLDENVPRFVAGDPGRLRQVLTNLIGNALKFTAHGSIRVFIKKVSEEADGVQIKFKVQDTGIGISREVQDKIFDSFTQADGNTTRRYGGTGLGLAIAKQLVNLMKGNIGVESSPGEGSCFWFTAELRTRRSTQVPSPFNASRLQGLRVLMISNDSLSRASLRQDLRVWGMELEGFDEVSVAASEIRVARASHRPYGLILIEDDPQGSKGALLEHLLQDDPSLATLPLVTLESSASAKEGASDPLKGIIAELKRAEEEEDSLEQVRNRRRARRKLLRSSSHTDLYNCIVSVMSSNINVSFSSVAADNIHAKEAGLPSKPSSIPTAIEALVVEDNLINQEVIVHMLDTLGVKADVAPNGKEALEALKRKTYHLVFMDCAMPEMDGYSCTAEIRRREEGKQHLPIIALTAHALKDDIDKCLDAGMDDVLNKPLVLDDLRRKIAFWGEKNRVNPT
jgi:CheY-like chemotaxis protein